MVNGVEDISDAWSAAQGALGAYGDLVASQGAAELAIMKAEGAGEEELAAKKDEIAQKAFDAQKATSIAEATINGLVAVTKAFATVPAPWNIAAAAAVAALSATQVGLIAAQQYVPMAQGGSGTVTKPTLFLAGEAGPEDYAFGPKRKGGLSGGSPSITIVQNIAGSVLVDKQLRQMAVGAVARAGRGY